MGFGVGRRWRFVILVWIGEVGLLWFEQRLCGSRWEVAGDCRIPIWQSSLSWVWFFKKNCWFGFVWVWFWFCYGSWFCFEMCLIWVCLRFDVGWLFVWVDLCLIVLLVICWVWNLMASLSLTPREFLAWRRESKEKGMRGLRLTVLESVWS